MPYEADTQRVSLQPARMGLRAVVADTGDDGETLVEERRARAASPLERRDSRVTSVSAFAFLVSCAALQLAFPGDRHPSIGQQLGAGAFLNPTALGWLLRRGYADANDRNLTGLASPARISLLTIIIALILAGLLWALSTVVTA